MSPARTDPIPEAQPEPARAGPAADTPAIPARWTLLAGITGPVFLAAYFIIPALIGWPSAGESPGKLAAYAAGHRLLFYLGCTLLLSVVVIEAALPEAVPMAAPNGDQATVATAFALSNGLFLIAGLTAVSGTAGLILATVMSAGEAVWIPAAAIAFAQTTHS